MYHCYRFLISSVPLSLPSHFLSGLLEDSASWWLVSLQRGFHTAAQGIVMYCTSSGKREIDAHQDKCAIAYLCTAYEYEFITIKRVLKGLL